MNRLPPPSPHRHHDEPERENELRDERELAGYVPTGDAADQEAAAWLMRRQGPPDAQAEAQFQHWLARSPAHHAAFMKHQRAWTALDALPARAVERLRDGLPHADVAAAGPAQPRDLRAGGATTWLVSQAARMLVPHSAGAAGAAFAVVVAAGTWLGYDQWQNRALFSQTFVTARGQLLDVSLPDGSKLQLDTGTRAEVSLYRQRREVRLPEGQSAFQVQADPDRPFEVLAGPLRITVLGTRFSVRYTANTSYNADSTDSAGQARSGAVQVAVEEGRVKVAPASAPVDANDPLEAGAGVLLTAGQAVSADSGGHIDAVSQVSTAAFAPWRNGRIAFDNTALADVLAEFERYGDTHLRIHDPAIARMRVSGSVDARKVESFARALPRALPVALREAGNGDREIVAAPP